MTVGHQLVELGNGVWEELVVEDGRERWERLWMNMGQVRRALGKRLYAAEYSWIWTLPDLRFLSLNFKVWICSNLWLWLYGGDLGRLEVPISPTKKLKMRTTKTSLLALYFLPLKSISLPSSMFKTTDNLTMAWFLTSPASPKLQTQNYAVHPRRCN
jgi:hypothetical protein